MLLYPSEYMLWHFLRIRELFDHVIIFMIISFDCKQQKENEVGMLYLVNAYTYEGVCGGASHFYSFLICRGVLLYVSSFDCDYDYYDYDCFVTIISFSCL